MKKQTKARNRRQPARRSGAATANRNGAVHARRAKATKPARRVTAASPRTNGKSGQLVAAPEMERSDPQFQGALKSFSAAARYFQKQEYKKAEELFEKVASSAARELAERARVHLVLCSQKLGRPAPTAKTAADHYDIGIAELNARHLELAIDHLSRADKSAPGREHIQYALAAAHAQQGNTDVALGHLKTAIALRPGNRFQVRYDDDFQPLTSDPRFKRLVSLADGHTS